MDYITLKEAAIKAGVHENTARFHRDKFEEYFIFTGEGRYRKYAPATIDLLRFIKSCYDAGMDAGTIRKQLGEKFGYPVIVNKTEVTSPQENFTEAVADRVSDVVKKLFEKQEQEIEKLRTELEKLQQQLTTIENNNKSRDQEIMKQIRQIQEEAQKSKKPWWKFW